VYSNIISQAILPHPAYRMWYTFLGQSHRYEFPGLNKLLSQEYH
jgi:hypothetical protein